MITAWLAAREQQRRDAEAWRTLEALRLRCVRVVVPFAEPGKTAHVITVAGRFEGTTTADALAAALDHHR